MIIIVKQNLFKIFITKESIDLNKLVCNSYFEHFRTKKQTPEVDGFDWIKINEVDVKCAKSMSILLNKLLWYYIGL